MKAARAYLKNRFSLSFPLIVGTEFVTSVAAGLVTLHVTSLGRARRMARQVFAIGPALDG